MKGKYWIVLAFSIIAACDMMPSSTTDPDRLIGGWVASGEFFAATLTFSGTTLTIAVTDGVDFGVETCDYIAHGGILTYSNCSAGITELNGISVSFSITGNTLKYGADRYTRP